MIAVVLADERPRQESEDDFGPGQADQAYKLFECSAVSPIRKRLQDVLRSGVTSAKKPDVGDSQCLERAPRLDFADFAERRGLLRPGFVGAAAAARSVHHGDALAFVQRPRQIGSGRAFIVGMRNDQKDVGLVTIVGLRKNLGRLRGKTTDAQQQNHYNRNGNSLHARPSESLNSLCGKQPVYLEVRHRRSGIPGTLGTRGGLQAPCKTLY